MAYKIVNLIGASEIGAVDTTKRFPLGTRAKGLDPSYGQGEFIYLKGVASTAAGNAVIYDNNAGTTTRTVAGSRGPVAIATAATVASTYGWYQIARSAGGTARTVAAHGHPYLTATGGSLDDAVVSGDKIDGARFKTADGTPAAGQAVAEIQFPALNGNG